MHPVKRSDQLAPPFVHFRIIKIVLKAAAAGWVHLSVFVGCRHVSIRRINLVGWGLFIDRHVSVKNASLVGWRNLHRLSIDYVLKIVLWVLTAMLTLIFMIHLSSFSIPRTSFELRNYFLNDCELLSEFGMERVKGTIRCTNYATWI